MLNYIENHLIPGETIVCKARLSKVLMMKRIAAAIVLLAVGAFISSQSNDATVLPICLLIAVAMVALKWVDIRKYELAVTNRKIASKNGLIKKTVQDCPLDKIDTVNVKNDFVGAICGYGTVVITAVNGTFNYPYIVNAQAFKNDIMNAINSIHEEEATLQAQKLAAALRGAMQ